MGLRGGLAEGCVERVARPTEADLVGLDTLDPPYNKNANELVWRRSRVGRQLRTTKATARLRTKRNEFLPVLIFRPFVRIGSEVF